MMELPTPHALFRQETRHVYAAYPDQGLPQQRMPEIAVIGRSNVGKSSLINALLGHKKLAHTSQTPGRTRAIHYYNVGTIFYFVDLPGYGFAKMSKTESAKIAKHISLYIANRRKLKRVLVLIDIRRGFRDADLKMIEQLSASGVAAQIVLTKKDKLKPHQQPKAIEAITEEAKSIFGIVGPVLAVSSETKDGLAELQESIHAILTEEYNT